MKKIAILCGLFVYSMTAFAADEQGSKFVGDAAAGKAKSITCSACHGPDGNSLMPDFPSIAGQHAKYLVKQLKEFKLGAQTNGNEGRYEAVMSAQSLGLSEQDMHDLAAYYASQPAEAGSAPEEVIEMGMALFMGGDVERGITACAACHGPNGAGAGLAGFPKVQGQHPAYTAEQLKKFRDETRANDPNNMMRDIAAKLTDEDIEVLAKYLRGLH